MNRILTFCVVAILITVSWTFAHGQPDAGDTKKSDAPTYRVMSVAEMFEGDEAAKAKISQMLVTVKVNGKPAGIHRTDMDVKDYERALNRLAAEGWTLVTVNKSNYWVFKK